MFTRARDQKFTMHPLNLQHMDGPIPSLAVTENPAISESDHPSVLADIYQDSTNIAVWQRRNSELLQDAVRSLLTSGKLPQIELTVTPQNALDELQGVLRAFEPVPALVEDMAGLVELFCGLLEQEHVKLRLTTLDRVMCPRFHVDRVPCRLVSTYIGCSTQWLPHEAVDRSKLGKGNNGLPDELSGIYRSAEDIRQMADGDVALLKGSLWKGAELRGLVHRSPTPEPGETRLLFTLDFVV